MREKFGLNLEDFEVRMDVRSPRSMKYIYFISTPHDPSVGIWGLEVSPTFRKVSRMQEYWRRYGQQIIKAYSDDKLTTEQFQAKVKRTTKGWN